MFFSGSGISQKSYLEACARLTWPHKRHPHCGRLLTCHDENSKVMEKSLEDFDGLLKEVTQECLLPEW